eukprot:251892-Alexandrium_andersonii.AAC.1
MIDPPREPVGPIELVLDDAHLDGAPPVTRESWAVSAELILRLRLADGHEGLTRDLFAPLPVHHALGDLVPQATEPLALRKPVAECQGLCTERARHHASEMGRSPADDAEGRRLVCLQLRCRDPDQVAALRLASRAVSPAGVCDGHPHALVDGQRPDAERQLGRVQNVLAHLVRRHQVTNKRRLQEGAEGHCVAGEIWPSLPSCPKQAPHEAPIEPVLSWSARL